MPPPTAILDAATPLTDSSCSRFARTANDIDSRAAFAACPRPMPPNVSGYREDQSTRAQADPAHIHPGRPQEGQDAVRPRRDAPCGPVHAVERPRLTGPHVVREPAVRVARVAARALQAP